MTHDEIIKRLQSDRPMPPQGFEARQDRILAGLTCKEDAPMKRKLNAGLVFALILMLLTVTAFAATGGFGLLDILSEHQNRTILPEAQQLVDQNIPQSSVSCQWADFEIRDAAYDGLNLYLTAVVRPLQDRLLFTEGFVSFSADKIRNLGISNDEDLYNYCRLNNATVLSVYPRLQCDGVYLNMFDWVWEEDGSMSCLLVSEEMPPEIIQNELTITFNLQTMIPLENPDRENWNFFTYDQNEKQQGSVTFTVRENGVRETKACDVAVDFDAVGVRIDRIEMVSTAFGTRASIDYTIMDEEKYRLTDDGLWFEYLDENGNIIGSGALGGGSIGPIDESTLRSRQTDSLAAMDALPDTVTLRAYNCWTKERYETHALSITPQ